MHELAKVTLENEMDLMLAHRRSMKLGELAGLTLQAQTTFATAVSEVSRTAIGSGRSGCLSLCVDTDSREKFLVASVTEEVDKANRNKAGLEYAKRLVTRWEVTQRGKETAIDLYFKFISALPVDAQKVDEWRRVFRNEPPISAYDEIKRQNEQLRELAEKVQDSETQYKVLTNALPLIIFSMDREQHVTYANDWLTQFTGATTAELNSGGWEKIIHPDDYVAFSFFLPQKGQDASHSLKIQCRLLQQSTGHYLWHLASLTALASEDGSVLSWTGFMADIHAQKVFERTLQDNQVLLEAQQRLQDNEKNLKQSIQELNRSNQELQQFAYVASHDLQEPIRKIIFYNDYLLARHDFSADAKGETYLRSSIRAAQRMRDLIKDLLTFSQVTQAGLAFAPVNLNQVVHEVLQDYELTIKEKNGTIVSSNMPVIEGNGLLIRQLFMNLLSNALKYSKADVAPEVEISHEVTDDRIIIRCSDNGIGFDEKYTDKLFTLFQRLHNRDQYAGTGLGLAICRKIAELHGGTISGSGISGAGATFTLSLPLRQTK
ncbi:MAG: histidine kinase [Flaviaesturariibacter sp.]|nr:histidine kinase [Flaviaesturariibacter sp.]